jgi:hypothetical protein
VESHFNAGKLAAMPTAAVAHLPTPADNVRAWWRKARRVYLEATLRACRFDWAAFIALCKPRGALPLLASPATVAAFIEACAEAGKKTRHRAPVSRDHRLRASSRETLESQRRRRRQACPQGPLQ